MSASKHEQRNLRPVDRLPEPLTPREHRRLAEIIELAAPDLLPLARDAVNARWLTEEECEALTGVLLGVFLAHLGPDDEPDGHGAEADDLLGRLQLQRGSYWSP